MSATPVQAIPVHDAALIQAAQVITCLTDAAKELLENSIDAGARKITLKFTRWGLDGVEVSDDGHGIAEADWDTVMAHHATSKMSSFASLGTLTTLGFRGEALGALRVLSDNVVVTTCTARTYPLGHALTFTRDGTVLQRKKVSATVGTTVSVGDLFVPLPVRRRDFERNAKRDFVRMVKTLQAHAVIRTGVRIEMVHVLDKGRTHLLGSHGTTGSHDLARNIGDIFGVQLARILVPLETVLTFQSTHRRREEVTRVEMHGFLSNLQKEYGQRPERQLTYINSRPCHLPKVLRTINEAASVLGANRNPFVLLNFIMPPDSYDVNISPDKRTIFLHDEQIILDHLRQSVIAMFSNDTRIFPAAKPSGSVTLNAGRDDAEPVESPAAVHNSPKNPPSSEQLMDHGSSDHEAETREVLAHKPCISTLAASEILPLKHNDSDLDPAPYTLESQIKVEESHDPSTAARDSQSSMLSNFVYGSGGTDQVDMPPLKRRRLCVNIAKAPRQSQITFANASKTAESSEPDNDADSEVEGDGITVEAEQGVTGGEPRSDEVIVPATRLPEDDPDIVLQSSPKPLQRFVNRLKNFEHSNISHHVRDLSLSIESSGALQIYPEAETEQKVSDQAPELKAGIGESAEDAEQSLSLHVSKSDFFGMTVIGQFNLGFIIVRRNNELFIIDQHASDEKSNYERLIRDTIIQSQKMARPKQLELSAMERLSIDDHLETLQKNGFEISRQVDEFGESQYLLVALPVTKNITFDDADLLEVLHLLNEGTPPEAVRCTKARRMFASRACRSSIMIGTALSHDRMQAVVWHLGEMDAPWNCPHGRPTMRHLMHTADMESFRADYS